MAEARSFAPQELERILAVERRQAPFLLWRDASRALQIIELQGRTAVTVGRRSSNDLPLAGDSEASRAHARLERRGEDWVVLDDGISRNGTFIDGVRVTRGKRLADGDQIRFGTTVVQFRNPTQGESVVTNVPLTTAEAPALTPTQQRILTALCRPLRDGGPYATPASNPEIAREVFLGVDAIKAHLRELYRRFGIDLPQNQKRARLAEYALQLGLVGESEV